MAETAGVLCIHLMTVSVNFHTVNWCMLLQQTSVHRPKNIQAVKCAWIISDYISPQLFDCNFKASILKYIKRSLTVSRYHQTNLF